MTTKKTPETTEQVAKPENNDCFIIMPIADHSDYKQGHFKRVYEDIFKPACEAAGYRPVRADDTKQANLIQLDILQKLLDSPMAICDLSTRNPNVLFELGLRQAFDKPTILVQEEGTPKIFDINIFRYVEYHNGLDYRDVLADQKAIQEVLEETKQAVQNGKSVNSIIRLLSITNPASLQDSSKFEEKEYFQVLMSEIQGVKNLISNRKMIDYGTSKIQIRPSIQDPSNLNKKNALIKVSFYDETIIGRILDTLQFIRSLSNVDQAELKPDNGDSACIWVSCEYFEAKKIADSINSFVNEKGIDLKEIKFIK